jgi:hypothetical protein
MPDITAQEIKTLLDFLQGIGAINANPTANTLQARLKAILDALNSGIEVSGPLTDAELRAAAVQVAINGSLVTIGATQYRMIDANTIVGLNADKPTAAAAVAAVGLGVFYWSVDTDPHGNAIEVSDGANWTVI